MTNVKPTWVITGTFVRFLGVFVLVLKVHCFGIVRHSMWHPLKKHFVSSDQLDI